MRRLADMNLVDRSRRTALAAGVAIGLLIIAVGVATGIRLGEATGASAVGADFIEAIGRGDARVAWSDMQVLGGDRSPTLVEAAFDAGLAQQGDLHFTDVRVVSSQAIGDTAVTAVEYRSARRRNVTTLLLKKRGDDHRYLFYPDWRVQIAPTIVEVTGPPGAAVAVDGVSAGRLGTDGAVRMQLLLGRHRISSSASMLYEPEHAFEDVGTGELTTGVASATTVHLRTDFTTAAVASAQAAVRDTLKQCESAGFGYGCPTPVSECDCTWSLVGDPLDGFQLAAVAAAAGDGTSIDAYGIYRLIGTQSNSQDPDHPLHRWSAGEYDATLTSSATKYSVASITTVSQGEPPTDVPQPVQITDADVVAAVSAAFHACMSDPSQSPSDCPQQATCYGDSTASVTWQMLGDPVDPSSTQVLFDRVTDSYQVSGTYSVGYSINSSRCFFSSSTGILTGDWGADVVWDGTNLMVVDIVGVAAATNTST
jgi:hypothetical protein